MGLPCLTVPDSLVPELGDILNASGFIVERIDVPRRNGWVEPSFCLICRDRSGAAIRLRFAGERGSAVPTRLTLVLEPFSLSWQNTLADSRLLEEVAETLQSKGAVKPLPRP